MSEDALIRLNNLRQLGFTAKELETRVGGRYTYWRDMLLGQKSFGEKAARKIEAALGLARGRLDAAVERDEFVPNQPAATAEQAHAATNSETKGQLSQMALDLALAFDEELQGRVERSQAYIKMMSVVTSIVDGRGALPIVEPAPDPKKQHV